MNTKQLLSSAAAAALAASVFTSAPANAQSPIMGELRDFGFDFCPRGWVPAHGQLLQIGSYTALFSLYGTVYGGDGRTNFAVPDLRGRAPLNEGRGPGLTPVSLGEKDGTESFTLSQSTMAAHSHSASTVAQLHATTASGNTATPSNTVVLARPQGTDIYSSSTNNMTAFKDNAISATTTTENTGVGTPITHRGPYLAMNWCVSTDGTYPSRN